jgi:predicted transcriptional regulator
MEIHLTAEQVKAVEGLAAQNGMSPDEQVRRIVEDALQRQQDYERWFHAKVSEARAASERGEFMDHDEVGRMLNERYPG